MIGLRLLHTSLESTTNPEDPECESEGWVLEKNLTDTFKSIMQKLKKIGKSNQVDAGAEGTETQAVSTVG